MEDSSQEMKPSAGKNRQHLSSRDWTERTRPRGLPLSRVRKWSIPAKQVEALIDSHEKAGSFIEAPVFEAAAELAADSGTESL